MSARTIGERCEIGEVLRFSFSDERCRLPLIDCSDTDSSPAQKKNIPLLAIALDPSPLLLVPQSYSYSNSSSYSLLRPDQRRSKTENENDDENEDDWENQPTEEHNPEIRPFRRLEEEGTGSLPSTFLFRMNSCGGHTQTPWPQSSVKSVKSVVYLLSSVFEFIRA
jgi:hypothetical protein